jgi:NADPH:quinone reductase-like Zn-dependent oxidoreductase
MKAASCTQYGAPDVIKIIDLPQPTIKKDEVLVRVAGTVVSAGDARIRAVRFPGGMTFLGKVALGFTAPRQPVLGTAFSGIVESIGSSVTLFKPGDRVVGMRLFGVHAEYLIIRESATITHAPQNLPLVEAAALPFGGLTAQFFLTKARARKGERILINGATGEVGCMAVQLATQLGLTVTAVCSAKNASTVKKLGAVTTIDYANRNVFEPGDTYDIILDCHGNLSFAEAANYLQPQGRFVTLISSLRDLIIAPRSDHAQFITGTATDTKADIEALIQLVNSDQIKPVIGKTFDFDHIAHAHVYVDTGHKLGSALIKINEM